MFRTPTKTPTIHLPSPSTLSNFSFDEDELKKHSHEYNHDLSQHLYHRVNIGQDGFDSTYPLHILNEEEVTRKDYQLFISQMNGIYFLQLSNRAKFIIFACWITFSLIAMVINLSIGFSNISSTSNCFKQSPYSMPLVVTPMMFSGTTNTTNTTCTDLTTAYILTFLPAIGCSLVLTFTILIAIGIVYIIHLNIRYSKLLSFIEKNRIHFLKIGIELDIIKLGNFDFLAKNICIEMVKITNEREDSLIRMFKDDKEMKKNFSKRFSRNALSPSSRISIDYSNLYHDHYQAANHSLYYTSTSPKSTYTRLD